MVYKAWNLEKYWTFIEPRDIEIVKGDDEELGFILWFDENGHYIEDVTIGTPAYKAGLRQGDRLVEVNHHNVEMDDHEAVVQLVIESGNMVTLNVQRLFYSNKIKTIY